MLSVIGFLVILAPLVIVHEFGHFFFARLFGVKAEIFSVGFGPRVYSRQFGETNFRVSAIPLGGYVKLLGEDTEAQLSDEDKKRALHHQERWKRFWIFFGGPLFNFLYAILIYMAVLAIGEPQVASSVGRVVQHSPAEKAGFRTGDRIVEVNGKPVVFFNDLLNALTDLPEQVVNVKVLHKGSTQPTAMTVMTQSEHGYSIYGEAKKVGHIEGLYPAARSNRVGISSPESFAARAGVKTLDEVAQFNGKSVETWEELESVYAQAQVGPIEMKIKRLETGKVTSVTIAKPAASQSLAADWGLHSSELFIEKVVSGSPAEKAGIRRGDRIVQVGPDVVNSFFEMKDSIQSQAESQHEVKVSIEREGKTLNLQMVPKGTSERDPTLKKMIHYTIGVLPMLAMTEPEMLTYRVLNPIRLFYEGTERMVTLSWRNLVSIGKMFTGDVSVSTLGGPILIGKIAGDSLARGLISFLNTMAVLSVGLGILNVLPIPVLDGGHILLLAVEAVRRKRLTMRQMEIFQQVGLSLILLLMLVVMKNDVMRLPFFN